MAKLTKAEMKRTLPAMARQQLRAYTSKSERAAGKLVADWMRKSGLDTKVLAKLEDERQIEIQQVVEKARAQAAKHGTISHAIVRNQAKVLQALAKSGEFFTVPSFTLAKPVRISATPGNILRMSRIKPFDSFAKIRVDRKEEGQDKLSFIFEWFNNNTVPVAIDAMTFMSATGLLELSVRAGIGFNNATITVNAQIALGPFQSANITYESRELGGVLALNLPFWPGDGHEFKVCDGATNLTALHHPVAPFQKVLIEVSMIVDSECGSSFRSKADFESGFLGVSCPVMVLRVHQIPPESTPD